MTDIVLTPVSGVEAKLAATQANSLGAKQEPRRHTRLKQEVRGRRRARKEGGRGRRGGLEEEEGAQEEEEEEEGMEEE